MSITIINNQPVSFNSNINQLDDSCNCKGQPFCQLVENNDTTSFQFKSDSLGDNLVINGGFDSDTVWSYGGGELVVNGGFASGSSWTTTGSWSIGSGVATHPSSTSDTITQSGILTSGIIYRTSFDVSVPAPTSDYVVLKLGTQAGTNRLTTGTYVENITANGANLVIMCTNFFAGSVDNISVKALSWTISGGKATHINNTFDLKQTGILTNGKYYKITYTISGRTAGTLTPKATSTSGDVASSNGTHTTYITSNGVDLVFSPSIDFDGSIDNVSVYEVGVIFNYYISDVEGVNVTDLNNYTETIVNDHVIVEFPWDYQDLTPGCYKICISALSTDDLIVNGSFDDDSVWQGPLGSELLTNGDFSVDANWTKGTGWTIGGGVGNHASGSASSLIQSSGAGAAWTVKTVYTITAISGGDILINIGGTAGATRTTLGTYTETLLAGGSQVNFNASSGFNGSIDNASVKRISWTITSGVATHLTGNITDLKQVGILTPGETYRVVFTITGMTAGTLTPKLGTTAGAAATSDGSYQVNIVSNGTDVIFTPSSSFDGSIDNVQVYPASDDVNICSDCFSLKQSHGCSYLLSWYNIEDNFDFIYSTGYVHKMRVKGKLWKAMHKKDKKVFKYSDASRKVLYSDSDKVQRFTLEEMPEYMHDALSSGIDHDYFIIGEDHYTAEVEDYELN